MIYFDAAYSKLQSAISTSQARIAFAQSRMAPPGSHPVNWHDWSLPRSSSNSREHHLTRRELTAILKEFDEDEKGGVWQWFAVTSELLEKTRKAVLDIPGTIFVRSGDALHLACAGKKHGFQEIYTNDRRMLEAARHFNLTGVNVLNDNA